MYDGLSLSSDPSLFDRSKSSMARSTEEVIIRNPMARALWDKWQNVGFMSYERLRRLYDHLNYLQQLEDLKNFSWEEWRKRVSLLIFYE